MSRLHSIINQPPRTLLYSGGFFIGTLWRRVSYLPASLLSIEAQHFFITLNNIIPLILMVIAWNFIYISTEGIKKSNYKWDIWTAKLAEIHVIFSSFSCIHLFIKSFHWMQLLFAHKIRLFLKCHVIYHTHREEQSEPLISAQSLHPQAAVGRRQNPHQTTWHIIVRLLLHYWDVLCQLFSPAEPLDAIFVRHVRSVVSL